MKKIKPNGSKLIVHPLPSKETTTEGGMVVMDLELEEGEVVEVSNEYSDRYKEGDIVLYPKGAGISLPNYKKKNCLWLNGQAPDQGGDVWGIVTE